MCAYTFVDTGASYCKQFCVAHLCSPVCLVCVYYSAGQQFCQQYLALYFCDSKVAVWHECDTLWRFHNCGMNATCDFNSVA
jgi:hypothetical protein